MKIKALKPLLTSVLAAAAFGAISVGSTFALFTDVASTSISVASGKVEIESTASLVKYTSSVDGDEFLFPTTVDANASFTLEEGVYTKKNTGTSFSLSNGTLTISKMVPGDKIELSVGLINKSTVVTKYRLAQSTDNTGGLADALTVSLPEGSGSWTTLAAAADPENGSAVTSATISIEFVNHGDSITPREEGTDNGYQGKSVSYVFAYQAVQGNANVA